MGEGSIRQISADELIANVHPYCELLADAVNSGASIGFLPPVNPVELLAYWDEVRGALYEGSRILLAASANGSLVGSVQLGMETRANGSHRAEVMKLMVHTAARRNGAGMALMQAVESVARELGRTLLVLDTRSGDPSSFLYRKLGYIAAGEIPGYARSANGELHATTFFFKNLLA